MSKHTEEQKFHQHEVVYYVKNNTLETGRVAYSYIQNDERRYLIDNHDHKLERYLFQTKKEANKQAEQYKILLREE